MTIRDVGKADMPLHVPTKAGDGGDKVVSINLDELWGEVLDVLSPEGRPEWQVEWDKCKRDVVYFIRTYCHILDAKENGWIPFELWDAQVEVVQTVEDNQKICILKARQLGMTWLMLAYALWQMIFQPIAVVLIFSKRENEAAYLLSDLRLLGMIERLPEWMKPKITMDNTLSKRFENGSEIRAFPTNAGDSYTATFALVDEADLVPDLNKLLRRVQPTIDAGGKLVLLSRADKDKPNSYFKKIYRKAKEKLNDWVDVFLAWWVHPNRDEAWYEKQKQDAMENTGSLDDVKEQYPATDDEALEAKELNKRIPKAFLKQCYVEMSPIALDDDAIDVPDLKVWKLPAPGRQYVVGVDCAEGLPTSDESVSQVIDKASGEQVAMVAGLLSPGVHASYTAKVARWYNNASIMPENNNHGHAFILWLEQNAPALRMLQGHTSKKGWTTSTQGKVLLYDDTSEAFKEGEVIIHDFETYLQLQSIEAGTLNAPEGEHDDRADAIGFAIMGRNKPSGVFVG